MKIFIVLGGEDENKRPRTNKFLELYAAQSDEDKANTKVILSGRASFEWAISTTEASRMEEYLIRNNFPRQLIIREDFSMDTIGNMYFSYIYCKDLVKNRRNETIDICLITEEYHMRRASTIFELTFNFLKQEFPNVQTRFLSAKTKGHGKATIKEVALHGLLEYDFITYKIDNILKFERFFFSLPLYYYISEYYGIKTFIQKRNVIFPKVQIKRMPGADTTGTGEAMLKHMKNLDWYKKYKQQNN